MTVSLSGNGSITRGNESGTYEQWGEERKAAQLENAKEASEDL